MAFDFIFFVLRRLIDGTFSIYSIPRRFTLPTYRLRVSLERKHSFKIQDSVHRMVLLLTKFISFFLLMASNELGGRGLL